MLKNSNKNVVEGQKKLTAFVSGASSGIGYELAHIFAKEGYDLIVVARDNARLEKLKHDLTLLYKCNIHIISVDLSKLDSFNTIENYLQNNNLEVDVLVNNAGFGIHGAFQETEIQKELEMVNLQISMTLLLSKLVLPSMSRKRKGYILNVGSVYSFFPVPYQSVYGACKSFLLSFSLSFAHEVKKSGIKVTALCPGTTQTEFRSRSKVGISKIETEKSLIQKKLAGKTAKEVAEIGYQALMKGDLICVPGLTNRLLVYIASCTPPSLLSPILSLINDFRGVNSKKS